MNPAKSPAPRVHPYAREAPPHGPSRWIPGLRVLRTYRRGWLATDIGAGIVLAAILVPTGMGYAAAAGLPVIYGLYATMVPLVAYAIFGPSPILVLGPDSALAALIAATILPLAAGDPDRAVAYAAMLALLSGALCIVAGLARFGFITEFLSKPIRYGYLNGIALTVLIGQLPNLLGVPASGANLVEQLGGLARGVLEGRTNGTALAIGVSCLIVMLGFRRWAPRIPGLLIAVIGATLAVSLFDLAATTGIAVVGPLPRTAGVSRRRSPSTSCNAGRRCARHHAGSSADTSVLSCTLRCATARVDSNQSSSRLPPMSRLACSRAFGEHCRARWWPNPQARRRATGVVGALASPCC
jgi:hypothetical protein